MNQLILPYQKNVKKTFNSFYYENKNNNQIIENIKNIYNNSNNQIYICGERSFGKSHILYAACNYFKNKKCVYLPLKDYNLFSPDILEGFENYDLICIDDIDYIYSNDEWEYSFFVIINKILENSTKIIYTSSTSLKSNKIKLKDLQSRLSWGLVFMINNPNDIIKEKILNKTIIENEYNISSDICSYLMKREDRDLASLLEVIHKIGNYSLSTNKKINVKNLGVVFD